MYTVIKGRDIPDYIRGPGTKYPFVTMVVGDCFDVIVSPDNDYTMARTVSRVSAAAAAYRTSKKPLTRWTVRQDKDNKRVTCWRIK